MDKKILKRVKAYEKDFDRDTQRVELLLRNKAFLNELEKIKSDKNLEMFDFFNWHKLIRKSVSAKITEKKVTDKGVGILGENDFKQEARKAIENLPDKKQSQSLKKMRFEDFLFSCKFRWDRFCEKWHINPGWDGDINSLKKYMKAPVEIYWVEGKENLGPVILLRIDNWTIKKDINDIWEKIEKYQSKMWRKQEKKTNFTRDLCWFDLSKKHGLTPRKIAEVWIQEFPDEIEILVVRRINKKIDRSDLQGRVLNDSELLEAIKEGFLKDKYLTIFEEEKTFYTTGQVVRGKLNPPFIDVIKKAIKRMEKQIKQIESASPGASLDIGRILYMGRQLR